MLKILSTGLIALTALSGCKTTDDTPPQSKTSGFVTSVLGVETQYSIAPGILRSLRNITDTPADAPGTGVCFGKLTSNDNQNRVGIYDCAMAQGTTNVLNAASSISFIADFESEAFAEGGKTYREFYHNEIAIGRMAYDNAAKTWVLEEICTGENYDPVCDIDYNANQGGYLINPKPGVTARTRTYRLDQSAAFAFSSTGQAATMLNGGVGTRLCMGIVRSKGRKVGLFPCNSMSAATLTGEKLVLINTRDGNLSAGHTDFYHQGRKVGTAYISANPFQQGQLIVQMRTLCDGTSLSRCSISYQNNALSLSF